MFPTDFRLFQMGKTSHVSVYTVRDFLSTLHKKQSRLTTHSKLSKFPHKKIQIEVKQEANWEKFGNYDEKQSYTFHFSESGGCVELRFWLWQTQKNRSILFFQLTARVSRAELPFLYKLVGEKNYNTKNWADTTEKNVNSLSLFKAKKVGLFDIIVNKHLTQAKSNARIYAFDGKPSAKKTNHQVKNIHFLWRCIPFTFPWFLKHACFPELLLPPLIKESSFGVENNAD